MAEASRVSIDVDSDIDDRVQEADGLKESSMEMGERIAEIARSTSPVLSGDYEAGIEVQETKHGARVLASDYKSAWIEFGVPSQGIPAHFNLRKAVEAAGYSFRKK